MADSWPWLAMAGLGGLHGLNPATGWMLAAAVGLRSGDRRQALRALVPIGVGHVLSVALVALLVLGGLSINRALLHWVAGALVLISVSAHFWHRAPKAVRLPARPVGLALSSFLMSSLQGAGLMVVPALVPLCMGDSGFGAAPLVSALAAMAVHSAAMLLVTGLVAFGLCRGFDFWRNNC